ncbi:MAG: XdhC family protein [Cyanomargarita calcarea GSE-NOS-MK-12-04C]|uniref:XdhC family protein n=1 Tax=Cyanomargarita calcarea GSE-NOS-MK-12-04C TaxID=2839659 RepID=A0A951QST2_9CYAN|nr:XdhC family protein [Cyanomargarita calcarea GSE-NOS-MK-12-04C]
MNELQKIIEAFAAEKQSGKPAILATIVNTKGSTYRKPGARMLITSNGRMLGAFFGGCLENDVFEYSKQVMPGKPTLINYTEDDLVLGFDFGCKGLVQILLEHLEQKDESTHLDFIANCLRNRITGVIATVFDVTGQTKVLRGDRLMLNHSHQVINGIADFQLTSAILDDAQIALENGQSIVKSYPLSTGSVEVFIEVIEPPTPLIIFGAGHDAIPVASFAKQIGWHVTIVDPRNLDATAECFYMADDVILTHLESVHKYFSPHPQTVVVVMTHNYFHDQQLLKMLLPSCVRYLGVLGPKRRTVQLLEELQADGTVYTEEQLLKLHSPVGLDIGANTPEAIALSIIAEIQAVIANRSAGFLKHRQQPIHIDCYTSSLHI